MLVKKQGCGMRWWLGSVAGAAILLGMDPASAQQPAPTQASQERRAVYDIPSQELNSALLAFADRAGLQLFYDANRVSGRKSAGVSGTLTAPEALARLLAGTGFTYRFTSANTIALEALPEAPPGSTTLAPLVIEGRAQRGTGPVEGYLASNSIGATKTDTPLIETPQSISVVTADQMLDQGSGTVMQAVRYTPGAFTGQVGASNRYDYVILRGMVDRSIDNVYLDGLKMMGDDQTYSSFQIDPYFINRIDVVKGPASVLYGRSAPGGIVAIDSKKPLFEAYNGIEATFGTNDRYGLGFDSTGPVGDGTFAYRLTGLVDGQDTQFDHAIERRYAIAPSLTWKPNEDTQLTLLGYFQKDPEGGTHNGSPAEGTLFSHNGRYLSRHFFDGEPGREKFSRNQNMVGYQFEHRFDETWAVRQNTRYLNSDLSIDQIYQTGWVAGTDQLSRAYFGGSENLHAVSVDNQVQADFNTGPLKHTVLAGFDYQHRWNNYDWMGSTVAPIDAFDPDYGNDADIPGTEYFMESTRQMRQMGVYAQNQIAFEKWRLSLGLRQDWVRNQIHDDIADSRIVEKRDKLTARAGLLYLFDNGLAPYVSYSESFNPSLYTDAAGLPLKPTEGVQYEAGVKYQRPGSHSSYSAAIFSLDQRNAAVMDPVTFVFAPVGTIRSRGLELEAKTQLTDNFRVMAGYTYLDTVYAKSPIGNQGNTPPQVPKHMASIWGEYSFHDGALRGLSLGAGARYVGQSWMDADNTRKVPSYTVFDASLRYELETIGLPGGQFRLNANNLLDRTYIASCLEARNCYFGEERSVTATLSYKF